MMKPHSKPNIAEFCPDPRKLLATIKRLAENSDNVAFGSHSLDRMDERGITTLGVLRTLRAGGIVGKIEAGKGLGEWKCKVVERRKRAREIGVATIVLRERKLFIKTVEWKDL